MGVHLNSLHSALALDPAAPRDTLIAVIVAVAGGGSADPLHGPVRTPGLHPARAGRLATGCLIAGFGLLTVAEVGWAVGLAAAAPRLLEDNEPDGTRAREPRKRTPLM